MPDPDDIKAVVPTGPLDTPFSITKPKLTGGGLLAKPTPVDPLFGTGLPFFTSKPPGPTGGTAAGGGPMDVAPPGGIDWAAFQAKYFPGTAPTVTGGAEAPIPPGPDYPEGNDAWKQLMASSATGVTGEETPYTRPQAPPEPPPWALDLDKLDPMTRSIVEEVIPWLTTGGAMTDAGGLLNTFSTFLTEQFKAEPLLTDSSGKTYKTISEFFAPLKDIDVTTYEGEQEYKNESQLRFEQATQWQVLRESWRTNLTSGMSTMLMQHSAARRDALDFIDATLDRIEAANVRTLTREQTVADRIQAQQDAKVLAEKQAELGRILAEKQAELDRGNVEKAAELDRTLAEKQAEWDRIAAEKRVETERTTAEIAAEKKAELDIVLAEKQAELARGNIEKAAELDRILAEKQNEWDVAKKVLEREQYLEDRKKLWERADEVEKAKIKREDEVTLAEWAREDTLTTAAQTREDTLRTQKIADDRVLAAEQLERDKELSDYERDNAFLVVGKEDELARERIKIEHEFQTAENDLNRAIRQGELDEAVRANKAKETADAARLALDKEIQQWSVLSSLLASGGAKLMTMAMANPASAIEYIRPLIASLPPEMQQLVAPQLAGPMSAASRFRGQQAEYGELSIPSASEFAAMSPDEVARYEAAFGTQGQSIYSQVARLTPGSASGVTRAR